MTPEFDLSTLTISEQDALIRSLLPLVGQLAAAQARIAELAGRLAALEKPPKTAANSSLPPSRGEQPDRPQGGKPPRQGRPGVARALEPNPDRIVEARLAACPHCAAAWPAAAQTPRLVHDRIELPPIRPAVTRVQLFGGRCSCCGRRAIAAAPAGLEPGSPFGKSIEALVVYLHDAQAIGAQVRAAPVVACDETSVRVQGRTGWAWVFVTAAGVLHLIRPSRGAGVVRTLFGEARPRVWVSDSLGSQRGHAEWQVCLAHLLGDAQYAIDCGDEGFAPAFKRLLLRAIAMARRREQLRDSTLRQDRAELDRRLDRVLALPRRGAAASPAIVTTCSSASPTAPCRPPTTSPNGRCGRA